MRQNSLKLCLFWHKIWTTKKIHTGRGEQQQKQHQHRCGGGWIWAERWRPYLSAMRRNALLISWSVAVRPTPSTSYGSLLCAAPPAAPAAAEAESPFSDLNDPNLDPAMAAPPPTSQQAEATRHRNRNSRHNSQRALGSRRGGASKITDSRPRRLQRSLQQPHEPPPLARPEPRRRPRALN